MADAKFNIECDFVTETKDGKVVMSVDNLHLHLPEPENGMSYRVSKADKVMIISCEKTETKQ